MDAVDTSTKRSDLQLNALSLTSLDARHNAVTATEHLSQLITTELSETARNLRWLNMTSGNSTRLANFISKPGETFADQTTFEWSYSNEDHRNAWLNAGREWLPR